MKNYTIALLGLLPLMAVVMLLLGVSQGAVPFGHVSAVGWTLALGGALLLVGGVSTLFKGGAKSVFPYLMLVAAVIEGGYALWILPNPAGASAALVRMNPARMGELLDSYLEHYGVNGEVDGLYDQLVETAPYPQIVALHLLRPEDSWARQVPSRTIDRLSDETPGIILDQLDGAYQAFGHADGLLDPLAIVLEDHAKTLDRGQLDQVMPLMVDLAPPGGGYYGLEVLLSEIAAEEMAAQYDDLPAGDRAIADLVLAGRDQGNHILFLDARGTPEGLSALDRKLGQAYLLAEPKGAGGGKILRLRYRELRAGEIVTTTDGARPIDLVVAELTVRIELDGQIIYDQSFRGESPKDAWQNAPEGVSLREAYRLAAVTALNEELDQDFPGAKVP